MAPGILQRFPDITGLLSRRSEAESGIGTLLETFGSFGADSPDSPFGAVSNVLTQLGNRLDIDISGLSEKLPAAITTIQNMIPPSALEYVESIESAYRSAQDFLTDSAIAKAVTEGKSLPEVALAVIDEALSLFESRVGDLTGNLIKAETLEDVKAVFAALEGLKGDFPSHSEEFLPFVTKNLLGLSPDLLKAPLEHLNSFHGVLVPIESEALGVSLRPVQQTLSSALNGLMEAIDVLDPASHAAYQQIEAALESIESATKAVSEALSVVYTGLNDRIEAHSWGTLFSTYRTVLEGITIPQIPTIDTVLDSMAGVLEELIAQMFMALGVDDLTKRITVFSESIRNAVTGSVLGRIRQTVVDFLARIQQTIENVPIQEIQTAVEDMLTKVREELEALGITELQTTIEGAFDSAEQFVTEQINSALGGTVQSAVGGVLEGLRNLPITGLIEDLTGAIAQLGSLFSELEGQLAGYMDDFSNLVSQLDQLSFTPLSDEVIGEIDELKTRLAAITPDALSDLEKLAIKGALALLDAIDLESQVIDGLKTAFAEAESGVKRLIGQLASVLEELKKKAGVFNPEELLKPVSGLLDQAEKFTGRLSSRSLMDPLYKQVDEFVKNLDRLSPGRLLDPLQGPYNEMMGVVNRLNPDEWVAPLKTLYGKINELISYVDITPLLDELDKRQKELFAGIRSTILGSLDGLDLPEPLATFFAELRPLLEGITDAIFGNPDEELKTLGITLRSQFKPSSLFKPLDEVFDRLLDLLKSVPEETLTETMNGIRSTLGTGLDLLNPNAMINRVRSGMGRLSELSPAIILGMPLALPGFKLKFQAVVQGAPVNMQGAIATVSARFDAAYAAIDAGQAGSPLPALTELHGQLTNALRLRINELDTSGAYEAYGRLREGVAGVVPDFLKSPVPLAYADILSGLSLMRPSAKAERIDSLLERFYQRLKPLEEALEPAVNGLFTGIRDTMMLINPLTLKDAVKDIYDTIRGKVEILDPEALSASLKTNVIEPLTAPLSAIDPSRIKEQINESYTRVLSAVSTSVKGILDSIAQAVDEQLKAIREVLRSFVAQIKETISSALSGVKDLLDQVERLVFVELLDRLGNVVDNLGVSFDKELDRVQNAFDAMLDAIPV